MSTLTALARAQAVARRIAQPVATVRHVHVSDRPLVLIPLALAGEANAPLAAMVGDEPGSPRLVVVHQPRNRDQRFAFAAALAGIVVGYVEAFRSAVETIPSGQGREPRVRCADAPQVLVPNPAGIGFVRLLGRSTRFRRSYGEYAVDPAVPVLGRWLTFLAERAEYPGSCLLLAATDALALHWASGQSPVEDLNLAALLGWIDPPAGMTGPEAAAAAEDPVLWPPAGPVTDPTFDNEVLAPLIEACARAGDGTGARRRAESALEAAVSAQLTPTWGLMWRGVGLLRALPPGGRVAARWDGDKDAFTRHAEHLRAGGPPQPRRDSAVAAARRLDWMERALASYAVQRALDDPLVLAEYRMTGEAFVGIVTAAEPGPDRRLGQAAQAAPADHRHHGGPSAGRGRRPAAVPGPARAERAGRLRVAIGPAGAGRTGRAAAGRPGRRGGPGAVRRDGPGAHADPGQRSGGGRPGLLHDAVRLLPAVRDVPAARGDAVDARRPAARVRARRRGR